MLQNCEYVPNFVKKISSNVMSKIFQTPKFLVSSKSRDRSVMQSVAASGGDTLEVAAFLRSLQQERRRIAASRTK
jgi:hypothetical protein